MWRLTQFRRAFGALAAAVATVAASAAGGREAYIWQRQHDEDVAAAVRQFAPQLDELCVLVADVSWRGGKLEPVRAAVAWEALREAGKPIGLVVRLNEFGGTFARDDATARAIGTLLREAIGRARAAGVAVAEVQVDFDCAEAKLAGYRQWLEAWRAVARAENVRLTITALPAWLKHGEFAAVARAVDGFVLQVHSLRRPSGPDEVFALCDPGRALEWTQQAGNLGVPFRVALPTYGYVLGFDAAGKFLGVGAEGPERAWPEKSRWRTVRSDAQAMARLARQIEELKVPPCVGVIWFRLPVRRDRYNWDAVTFAAVLRGEVPERRIRAAVEWSEGLAEIVVVNDGQTTEFLPLSVELRWPAEARVLAADAIGGFRLEIHGGQAQGILRAADVTTDATVGPGRKVRIAWLRFAHEISLEVELAPRP